MSEQCDLVRGHKIFYIIVNISVDSTDKYYSGNKIKKVREPNIDLRSRLQSDNAKSAKRHIKTLSGREHRFATNTNHIIYKEVIKDAKAHILLLLLSTSLALE